jgi:hypothetical protein
MNYLGRKDVFVTEIETELIKHCLQVEQLRVSTGLSCSSIRQITFQLAKENGIPHPFFTEYGRAGKKELWGFLDRTLFFHLVHRNVFQPLE